MPIPADFNQKAAAIQAGALAYAAAVIQPGQKAEDIIPGMKTWLVSQSDSVRTLQVTSVQEHISTVKVLNDQGVVSSDTVDVFVFVVQTTYLEDGASATTSVALSRASIEG